MKVLGLALVLIGLVVLFYLGKFLLGVFTGKRKAEDSSARWHPVETTTSNRSVWQIQLGEVPQRIDIASILMEDPDFEQKYLDGQQKATDRAAYLNLGRISNSA